MSETQTKQNEETSDSPFIERFHIESIEMLSLTILFGLIGSILVFLLTLIPFPYQTISLFKLGFVFSLALIAVIGSIRGPIAGFLSGYLGLILNDFFIAGTIVGLTLPAASYGVLGFIVGLGVYDFEKGKSLAKLSIMSAIGLVFTLLLILLLALSLQSYSLLAAIGFVILPIVTTGFPSVILLPPILARLWLLFMNRFLPDFAPD
ncbi:MAG: hypothetical protein GF411_06745 [Candidatus Lokiarchaeota archaeon]|nr:hypothetical protein [Candidatus Lokiarchaeota archaeon]